MSTSYLQVDSSKLHRKLPEVSQQFSIADVKTDGFREGTSVVVFNPPLNNASRDKFKKVLSC